MLDNIRKSKDNLIFTLLIVATAAVMALYGIGNFKDKDQGGDGVAALVNGEAITRREFRQELDYKVLEYQSRLGGQFDEKLLTMFQVPQRTLEELVQYKLMAQQAKQLKIIVPDFELAENIRSLPYYQKNGKFDAESYAKMPNRGTEERRRRERLQLSKLQGYLIDRVRVTPAEAKRAYELKETKADLEVARIDFNALAADKKPSSSEIDKFLATNPETELKAYFDSHKSEFSEKAQVNLNQIRVGIPFQAAEAKKSEAKKKIEDVAKEVNEKNFAEMAKKHSDDEHAKKGGTVGWIARGTLEPSLEKAIDKLETGKVSPPVETPFGYFLLQVTEKKDAVTKPLDAVKKTVAEKVLSEKLKKTFIDETKAAWEKSLADGKSIESELKKYKVEAKATGPFSLGQGYIPNVGQVDTILDAVFDLSKEKPIAPKLFYHMENYYFVKLKSLTRASDEEFAKNRETVERSVAAALQSELISHWVQGLQKNATVKNEMNFKGGDEPPVAVN